MARITSRPLENGELFERGRKQSAVISRAQIDQQRGVVERIMAYVLLIASYAGTIVAFHGGWAPILQADIRLSAVLGGILGQTILTWLQWSYYRRRLISWSARMADTVLTVAGYGPLFVGVLAQLLVGLGVNAQPFVTLPWVDAVSWTGVVAWSIITLVSFLLAWYPERTLVD